MQSLIQRFKMKHMPRLLNGDYWKEMESYLDSEPSHGYYRNLLIEFIDEQYGEEVEAGEIYTRIFGVGSDYFSFNEHNLQGFPMSRCHTLYDAVYELTRIQYELMNVDSDQIDPFESCLEQDLKYCNLWARYVHDETYVPVTINSLGIMAHFYVSEAMDEVIQELSPTDIHFDEDNGEVKVEYASQEHENVRYYLYQYLRPIYDQLVDEAIARFSVDGRVVVGMDTEDRVVTYTLVDFSNDSKLVSPENFLIDIDKLGVVEGDINQMIADTLKTPIDEVRQKLYNDFPEIYEKYKNVVRLRKNRIFVEKTT